MEVVRRILVPLDFSPVSRHALAYAVLVAERIGASLTLLHVLSLHGYDPALLDEQAPLLEELIGRLERQLERRLAAEGKPYDERSIPLRTVTLRRISPPRTIVNYARREGIDLIVMGTEGRGGLERVLLGGVAEQVVRAAPCPVLTVRHEGPAHLTRFRRILVPLDFSRESAEAARVAFQLAAQHESRVDLLHVREVVPRPTFYGAADGEDPDAATLETIHGRCEENTAELAERCGGRDIEYRLHFRVGAPAREIVELAAETGVDLVVMGTRGLAGLDRFLLGSVAERVISEAASPVLVVRGEGGQAGP